MLLELVIFAVVLVVLQAAMGLLMAYASIKLFMSKKFIKKYSKIAMEVSQEISEELLDEE